MRKSLVVAAALLLPSPAWAVYWESLGIPAIAQEENYYCGVTVIEMWAEWLEGSSESQDDIAADLGVTSTNGVNVDEMKEAMEDYTSNYFTKVKTSSYSSFASEIVQQIHSGEPMAVMANTRRKSGSVTTCGHWLLVDSYVLTTSSYSSSYSNLNGYYMNDPLYGSAWTGTYYYVTPTTFVTKGTFFGSMVSKCPSTYSYYYGVKD